MRFGCRSRYISRYVNLKFGFLPFVVASIVAMVFLRRICSSRPGDGEQRGQSLAALTARGRGLDCFQPQPRQPVLCAGRTLCVQTDWAAHGAFLARPSWGPRKAGWLCGERRSSVSLYIANFLGENEAQAQQIFKQVRKIYSSRSSAVHGNKTKDNLESAVEESANLLTRILRRCAELNKLPDVDNLAFRVDKQKQGIKCKILVP